MVISRGRVAECGDYEEGTFEESTLRLEMLYIAGSRRLCCISRLKSLQTFYSVVSRSIPVPLDLP